MKTLLTFLLLFGLGINYALSQEQGCDCDKPYTGMKITKDTTFCAGTYNVYGIQVNGSGTEIDPLEITCQTDEQENSLVILDGTLTPHTIGDSKEFQQLGDIPIKGSGSKLKPYSPVMSISNKNYAEVGIGIQEGVPEGEWAEHIKISGCTFQNYQKAASGGRYVTYENNKFIHIIRHAIMAYDGAIIKNNYFRHFKDNDHSVVSFFGNDSVLEDNVFEGESGRVVFETMLDGDVCVPPIPQGLSVIGNTFDINGQDVIYLMCVGGEEGKKIEIRNNLFYGNAVDDSVIFDIRYSKDIDIVNNTITNNPGAGLLRSITSSSGPTNSDVNFRNNIIAYNYSGIKEEEGINFSYNNSFGNEIWDYSGGLKPGSDGNISTNPQFKSLKNNDYHLRPYSPCIDAGDPADDYSQEPDYPQGQINMGAYGNTQDAEIPVYDCKIPTEGMKISEDTTLCGGEWSFNLTPFEAALKIDADNIVISSEDEEEGTTISGNRQGLLGIGLYNNDHKGVVIKDCAFQNLNFGMMFKQVQDNTLQNIKTSGNKVGIHFDRGDKDKPNYIFNSIIQDNKFVDLALYNGKLIIDSETDKNCGIREIFNGEIVVKGYFPLEYPQPEVGRPVSLKKEPIVTTSPKQKK